MKLMEDSFVISCHAIPAETAKWSDGKDRPAVCSHCKSLHPYEFIYQLQNGGFIRGWLWEEGKPLFCELDAGLFYTDHMSDMSQEWLLDNAYTIFTHTGLVFYWQKEAINWEAPFVGIRLGHGSTVYLSPEQHTWAKDLIAKKSFGRKLP